MATPFKIKRSSIPNKRPSLIDLQLGELALNFNDGRLFARREAVGIGSTVCLLNVWTENVGGGAYYTDGNIGVGLTNPTSKIHISGNALITGVTTSSGGFVGNLTGTALTTTNIPNLSGDISSNNTLTTLATVNSNVGTFGATGAIPVVTVNGKGLVTGVSTVAVPNGSLTLAVSGTGLSGSATFTANQSGNSTFTVTSNATSANTASTIVARDASGNFSAGVISANLTGNLNSSGINTATTLSGTTLTYTNGSITNISGTNLNYTGISTITNVRSSTINNTGVGTITTFVSTTGTITNLSGTNLNYTGISTITNVRSSTINNTGVGTITTLNGTQSTFTTSTIGVGTITTLDFGTNAEHTSNSTVVATLSPTAIDTFSSTLFRSARVQVQITQGTNYQASDVLIIHDGSIADVVEYGSIATNDYLATFSGAVSGGNCLLQINMSSATSATVKVLSQRITI